MAWCTNLTTVLMATWIIQSPLISALPMSESTMDGIQTVVLDPNHPSSLDCGAGRSVVWYVDEGDGSVPIKDWCDASHWQCILSGGSLEIIPPGNNTVHYAHIYCQDNTTRNSVKEFELKSSWTGRRDRGEIRCGLYPDHGTILRTAGLVDTKIISVVSGVCEWNHDDIVIPNYNEAYLVLGGDPLNQKGDYVYICPMAIKGRHLETMRLASFYVYIAKDDTSKPANDSNCGYFKHEIATSTETTMATGPGDTTMRTTETVKTSQPTSDDAPTEAVKTSTSTTKSQSVTPAPVIGNPTDAADGKSPTGINEEPASSNSILLLGFLIGVGVTLLTVFAVGVILAVVYKRKKKKVPTATLR